MTALQIPGILPKECENEYFKSVVNHQLWLHEMNHKIQLNRLHYNLKLMQAFCYLNFQHTEMKTFKTKQFCKTPECGESLLLLCQVVCLSFRTKTRTSTETRNRKGSIFIWMHAHMVFFWEEAETEPTTDGSTCTSLTCTNTTCRNPLISMNYWY